MAHRVTWSDRLWFSRAWRIAASAAVVAAIAIESLPGTADRTAFVAPPQAIAEAQVIDAAGREMGLPPNVAQALARRAVAMAADVRPRIDRRRWRCRTWKREGTDVTGAARRVMVLLLIGVSALGLIWIGLDLWAGRRVDREFARLEKRYGSLYGRSHRCPACRGRVQQRAFCQGGGRFDRSSSRDYELRQAARVRDELRAANGAIGGARRRPGVCRQ